MQTLDFVLVVIPLTIIVAALTGLVFYFARKEEFQEHKRTVAIQKFLGARSKQQAQMRKELENVRNQHESGFIDDMTYERLVNVLSMTQEKLRYEASMLLSGKDGVLMGTKLSVEEILATEPDKPLEPETNHEEQEVCEVKPEKTKKAKHRNKRKAKRKEDEKLQTSETTELQMGIVTENKAWLKPDEKNQPVSQ
jgi:hypothetical protein